MLEDPGQVFLDQNKLSEDGTSAVRIASWNEAGTVYAYGQSDKGSDWVTIKFKTFHGEELQDKLEKVRYSCLEWTKDGSGVFYNAYLTTNQNVDGTETTENANQILFYHRIGTRQETDIQIAAFPNEPQWFRIERTQNAS